MNINKFDTTEYLEVARDRVTMAFENKPVFDKYLQLLLMEQMEIQMVLKELMQERSIDTAIGKQLDIIGDIVGQPRELIDTDIIPYFGYAGNPSSMSYGDTLDHSVGGYYYDINTPLFGRTLLSDNQYRLFIKAKIMKNITRATPEDVIAFIKFVFNPEKIIIQTDSSAEVVILVSGDLDQFKVNLLSYYSNNPHKSYFIPKTLGVKLSFATIPWGGAFSFLGVPDGMGYGSLGESGGGTYASII